MDTALASNERYTSFQKDPNSKCERAKDFSIKHFAGDVIYSTGVFVDRNNDTLFQDLKRMLYMSTTPALKEMFPEGADDVLYLSIDSSLYSFVYEKDQHCSQESCHSCLQFQNIHAFTGRIAHVKGRQNSDHRKSYSLLWIFLFQNPYYVRCIKPNANKSPNDIDDKLVQHQVCRVQYSTQLFDNCFAQINYLGLMENLRVRRAGYCNRQPYEVFVARYKVKFIMRRSLWEWLKIYWLQMLAPKTWPHFHGDQKGLIVFIVLSIINKRFLRRC